MMPKPLTFNAEKALELANQGLRPKEIARQICTKAINVRRWLKKQGFSYKKGPRTHWGERKRQSFSVFTPTAIDWMRDNKDLIEAMAREPHRVEFEGSFLLRIERSKRKCMLMFTPTAIDWMRDNKDLIEAMAREPHRVEFN